MRHSFEQAAEISIARQQHDSLLKREMIAIRDRYNGDFVIPLGDVEGQPTIDPPTPAFVADAIDNSAMMAASVRPMITVPALTSSGPSMERAARRRKAMYASWHQSRMKLKLRRAYRQLAGYGAFSMIAMPDFKAKMPTYELRDPLTAYPDEAAPEEVRRPMNVAYIYPRSADWLVANYPQVKDYIGPPDYSPMWDMFEWIDDSVIYIGLLGPRWMWPDSAYGLETGKRPYLLQTYDNPAGLVPAVTPARVTLERVAGQVSKMVGVIDMMSRIMALEVIAAEKGVFPDTYLIGNEGETAQIAGGTWRDGRTGQINLLKNVKSVGELVTQLNPGSFQVADRMERAIRMSTGQPGVFGGELTGAIRSGQTVSQVGSYAIDPRVQELQEIMEYALTSMNESAVEVWKGYFPRRKLTIFSGWPTDVGQIQLDVNGDLESEANVVSYSVTGMDVTQTTVALGQAHQARFMSRMTAMRKHPMIDDPESEDKQLVVEAFEDATLQAVLAQATQGTLAFVDAARILQLYKSNGDMVKSVTQAQAEAQKRQATQAPPPQPGQVASPAAQPGLQSPGQSGVEQPEVPTQMQDRFNIGQLLGQLSGQGQHL